MIHDWTFPPEPRLRLIDDDVDDRRQWALNVRDVGAELLDAARVLMAVTPIDHQDVVAITAMIGAIYARLDGLTARSDH